MNYCLKKLDLMKIWKSWSTLSNMCLFKFWSMCDIYFLYFFPLKHQFCTNQNFQMSWIKCDQWKWNWFTDL